MVLKGQASVGPVGGHDSFLHGLYPTEEMCL